MCKKENECVRDIKRKIRTNRERGSEGDRERDSEIEREREREKEGERERKKEREKEVETERFWLTRHTGMHDKTN